MWCPDLLGENHQYHPERTRRPASEHVAWVVHAQVDAGDANRQYEQSRCYTYQDFPATLPEVTDHQIGDSTKQRCRDCRVATGKAKAALYNPGIFQQGPWSLNEQFQQLEEECASHHRQHQQHRTTRASSKERQ
jgi:hypothetical protein